MPRLTWDKTNSREVATAVEAHRLYTKHKFIAKHNGKPVHIFDATLGVIDFERVPSAYDRIMQEEDPWEN